MPGFLDELNNFITGGGDVAGVLADVAAKSFDVNKKLLDMHMGVVDLNRGLGKLNSINENIGKSFTDVAKKATFLEQRNSGLNKSFGITSNAAFRLSTDLQKTAGNLGISGVQAMKYAGSLKKLLPTMHQHNKSNDDTYKGLQMVQHAMQAGMGLTEEQANAYTQYAGAAADNASQMLAVAQKVADMVERLPGDTDELSGTMGAMKMITQGIADAGSVIQLQYGRLPGTLEMAVVKASKLGFELEDLKGTADNLLDIESSIGQELEYQLLSGHRLVDEQGNSLTNLYRQAALQGDMSKQADIMNKIVQDEGETLENNMFARKQMADMLGIQEEQLASAIQKQKILEKAGEAGIVINTGADEEIRKAAEELVEKGIMKKDEFETFMKASDTRTTNDILDQLVEVATEQKIYSQLMAQATIGGGVRDKLKTQFDEFSKLMMTQGVNQMAALGKALRSKDVGEKAARTTLLDTEGEMQTKEDVFIPASDGNTIVSGPKGSFRLDKDDDVLAMPGVRDALANSNTSTSNDMMKFAAAIVAAIQQQTNILSRSDSGYRQGINDYFN
jgi:hypothetical protein